MQHQGFWEPCGSLAIAVGATLLFSAVHALGADLLPGWPLREIYGFPAVADINGDGAADVIVLTSHGFGVINGAGHFLPGWPWTYTDLGGLPLVGDLNGDGTPEVVAPVGGGGFYAFDSSGNVIPGWDPVIYPGVHSRYALGDIDGDGAQELVFTKNDLQLLAIDGDGTEMPGWPVYYTLPSPGKQNWTSLAIGDMDFDGVEEVVAARYIHAGTILPSPVVVLRGTGEFWPGWPVILTPPLGPAFTEVALADLDQDGECEVIGATTGASLQMLRLDGETFWPPVVPAVWNGYVACGDLDADGDLEIVVSGYGMQISHHTGQLMATAPTSFSAFGPPSLGDVDGDGLLEIVILSDNMDMSTGQYPALHVFDLNGVDQPGWPHVFPVGDATSMFPALGDLDGDGDLEIVVRNGLYLYAFTNGDPGVGAERLDWSQYGGDAGRSRYYHRDRRVSFVRGDVNHDGQVDIADFIVLVGHLFSAVPISCASAADVDGNRALGLTDPMALIGYLVNEGPAPGNPFPDCHGVPDYMALTCDAECP
jgi:hypothetical protein